MVGQSLDKVSFVEIDENAHEQRVDNFLFKTLKGVPKSHIYQLLRKGNIRVNKKRIKAPYKLQQGDILRLPPIRVSEKVEVKISDELESLIQQSVIYEDASLLVLNKPSGLPVHGGTGLSLGVIDVVRTIYKNSQSYELVHRLDKETSGCLVIAKKRSALKHLQEQFRQKTVRKEYQTLTKGWWKPSKQEVSSKLTKNVLKSGERMVVVDDSGKSAKSVFETLQKFDDASLMSVRIQTGRTHQIRVHADSSGHPVAGDEKYGDRRFNARLKKLGLKRMFLHAYGIRFTSPETEKLVNIVANLPSELMQVIDNIAKFGK